MKTIDEQTKNNRQDYEIYGGGKVSLVIEMGLGAVMAEWRALAKRLSANNTVLLYQRAGYGNSGEFTTERTPENIADELYGLLKTIPHEEKITLLAHSQGGLYAWYFAKAYPEIVGKIVLLDPLSPQDYRFRTELTEDEFKKSGADKTDGLRLNLKLTRLHLGWLVKLMMAKAPPFYYYNRFSADERKEILSSLGNAQTYRTALAEYDYSRNIDSENGNTRLDIPVTLITHDSDISCREICEFGGANVQQARKIEALWQDIMKYYLSHTSKGELIRAKNSSHYIHLTDAALICGLF